IRNHDAEFERAESRLGGRVLLEEVPNLLVDGDALGPAGWRVGATLDVAGEEFDAGEEAAYAAHVAVAVAANLVGDTLQCERLLAERFERREDFLERLQFALGIRPVRRGDGPVGAEDEDDTLLPLRLIGEAKTRQVEDERNGRSADAKIADE